MPAILPAALSAPVDSIEGGYRTPGGREMTVEERLFELWSVPPERHGDPLAAFLALYADPVVINGGA
jgi:hypothetical protein